MANIDTSFTFFQEIIKEQFPEKQTHDLQFASDWSSLQLLIITCAIDEQYDVLISNEEIKKVKTLEDLHDIIIKKVR